MEVNQETMDATATPYNSLYGMVIPPSSVKEGPCCLHGKDCLTKQDDELAVYVNLVPTPKKMNERNERTEKKLRRATRGMKTIELGEESPEHKKGREKTNKKKKENECLAMDSVSDKCKEKPFDTLANLAAVVKEKLVKTCYLGVKTWKKAEESVTNPTDFRLYHRQGLASLNELEPTLSLFLVYMNASRQYKHFRVRGQTTRGVTSYSVEYGQMDAVTHPSLEHLVRFYHTQFVPHKKNGEQQFDAFPSWSDSSY